MRTLPQLKPCAIKIAGRLNTNKSRTFRSAIAILTIVIISGLPVHAAPVVIREVIQVIGDYQNAPDLRLRTSAYEGARPSTGQAIKSPVAFSNFSAPDFDNGETLLAGVAVRSSDPPLGAEITEGGDLEGTVCDCGEIAVAGGFPKWPLVFLGVIPFFFIHGCDHCDDVPVPVPTPSAMPTPTPNEPTPVPEPATLLLFSSSLALFGSVMRRRSSKSKVERREEES